MVLRLLRSGGSAFMHKAVTRFGKCALLLYEFYFLFRFFFLDGWLLFKT